MPLRALSPRTVALLLLALSPFALSGAEKYQLRTFKKTVLNDRFFAEGATYGDLNNDGKMDLIAGPYWYEGPNFEKQHEFYPPKPFDPKGYSDNFFAFVYDFNGDKWNDILIYGFPGKDASWFENPQGKDGHWKRHVVFDQVDNESPTWGDLTGDGKPEIIFQTDGFFGYATPDWSAPEKKWTFHKISDKSAGGNFTHGLGWGDVNGDGRADLLEKNGWWEQPKSLEGDPQWKKHAVQFSGPGGAQMYAYDVDGDGLNDVITSLAAHGFGLTWYKQLKGDGEPKFEANTITGAKPEDSPYGVKFAELHAIDLVDMNGDGLKDIVTGKRWWSHGREGDPERDAPAVIYWFELVRGKDGEVDWVPHLVDDDSGIGVQVVAGDFTGDGQPDIIVSNKKGTHYHVQQLKEVSKEEFEQSQPRRKEKTAQSRTPEDAARAMTVPPGFSVKLLAGEPDVQQPIAMAFDDRGRLWVAEAYSYPVKVKDEDAKDRILIFEDTDLDHKFDKRTVFYEGLNLVSGMELGFGGVYVGAAPNLLFIPDADGDDKPDGEPQVLLDGWGYEDTHETLNSFIWGPDGWLYGCHGVFTKSLVGKPGTPKEERKELNAGIWRYHPTRHEFEVFAEGTSNPWGVDFNDRGHAFATACVIPHLYHIIQGGRYTRQAGPHVDPYTFDDIKTIAKHRHWVGNQWNPEDRTKSDSIGGGHAHAGAMFYLGGSWPKQYHNQLFMNNIHGARLNQDQITKTKGSGYEGDAAPDFCFANDVSSQIIYLTYGPDGQVTMIDWYDLNQCHHGKTDGHDRTNGRIFKILYNDAKAVKVDLKKLSNKELVDLQYHKNEWYRRHARRILQERALKVEDVDELEKYLSHMMGADETTDEERLRLRWTSHVIGGRTFGVGPLNEARDPYLSDWALRLACERPLNKFPYQKVVAAHAAAKSPVIRLAAASAMQRIALEDRWQAAAILISHSDDASDHNLPLMYWYGIEPLVMADTPRAMKLAAESKIPLVSRFIVRRAAAEEKGYEALLDSLAGSDEATQAWMLEEIVAALKVRANMEMPKSWTGAFEKLIKNAKFTEQVEFIAVKFGDERVLPKLRSTLADRKLDDARRNLALQALLAGKDKQLPAILRSLLDDPKLRLASINGLASFDDPATPKALLDLYAKFSASDKQAALATLTSRADYVLALLDAIEAKQLDRNDLSAFTVRNLSRLEDKRVVARLNEVWGTIRETPAEKAEELAKYKKALNPDVLSKANLPHGRELFNKTCGTCHKLFDSGKNIGPDITGSNRTNIEYLLDNMLDPGAVIGRDYQVTEVETNDGRIINGIVKEENATAVTLQTPTNVVTIPKADIGARNLSKLSLMPEGQLKPLPPEDVRDLVGYLTTAAQVPLPGEGPWLDPKTRKVAGALEGESLKILAKSGGDTNPQDMKAFDLGKWSGDAQLWWTGGKPGDKLVFEVAVEKAGRYQIYATLCKAVDYGIVQLQWDTEKPSQAIDCFNDGVVTTPPILIGTFDLKPGKHKLTAEITGANDKAVKAYMFGLDYVALIPIAEEK
jgi:putative membrane-bound dehydrogenase-like protein